MINDLVSTSSTLHAASMLLQLRAILITVLLIGAARFLSYKLRFPLAVRRVVNGRVVERQDIRTLRRRLPRLDTVLDQAALLPLPDAASLLWLRKPELYRELSLPRPKGPPKNLAGQAVLGTCVRKAITRVNVERDTAHRGSTFSRLMMAHPTAENAHVESTIKAAITFEKDCWENYAKLIAIGVWDVRAALDMARRQNPDFLEATSQDQENNLRQALR